MKDRYKIYGYEITTDPEFQNKKYGVTPWLAAQFVTLHKKSLHPGDGKIIDQLTQLIVQYPTVPILKNYLSVAYNAMGNYRKAQEVNNWILAEHPDYLFARLNKAHDFVKRGEYEKIPQILGEEMEIKALYPDRNIFHLTEVTSFLLAAIRYFIAVDKPELAENRLDMMMEIAPDHPHTREAEQWLWPLRFMSGAKRWEEEMKQRIAPVVKKVVKNDNNQAPVFNHPEIATLYENGIKIPCEKLRDILLLPRQTLIEDLETILMDSINRYGYFTRIKWKEQTHTFLVHALFLLMELESTQSLPLVLKVLESDNEFIELYFGDHLTGTIWQCLYKLGFSQTDVLKEFLQKPGIDTFCKVAVSDALCQMILHHPEKRLEISGIFKEVFTAFEKADPDDNLMDNEFLGLAVGNAVDAKLTEMLPLIKKLFDKNLVATGVNGDFQEVKKYFTEPEKFSHKKEIYTLVELYDHILKTWSGFCEPKNKSTHNEAIPQPTKSDKIGRNDPCPCGSGKKYKKCCMKDG